mgnify:CR=1 FL=1
MDELIQGFKLYEKTSKNGNIYYVGRFGSMKVVVMRSDREKGNSGEAVWNVMFGKAQPAVKREAAEYQSKAPARAAQRYEETERDADDPALAF